MNKKLAFSSLTFLLGGLLLSSCGEAAIPSAPRANSNVTGISFQISTFTFENIGESFTLEPTITYKPGTTQEATLKWVNSNPKAVSLVDKVVTAKSFGSSTITAIAGNYSVACTFTVKDNSEEIVFEIDSKTLKLKPGSISPLSVSVNGTPISSGVRWASSNEDVATVSDGLVTAVNEGEADISATYNSQTVKCHVTVSNEAVEFTITVSPSAKSINVGESFDLVVETNDPTAVVSFSSSNSQVATVSNSGHVEGAKKGSAVITASANGKSATCNVTVTEAVDPQKDAEVYFFLDYNNIDPDDESGEKLLARVKWYRNQPLKDIKPADPTTPSDPAFPYFIGWSDHSIIDSKDQLWDFETRTLGYRYTQFLYGIWSDVPKGEFLK